MTELEKSYIAGLIDGEGSILLERPKTTEFRHPAISIATTTIELIDFLPDLCGGNISSKQEKDGYLSAFSYKIRGDKALDLMQNILPYLKCKNKIARAEYLLKHYKENTVRNGKYNAEQLKKKQEFEENFFKL